jgi:Domain of unknown function (DUF6268)
MKKITLISLLFAALAGNFYSIQAQPYLDLAQGMFSTSPGSNGQPKKFNHLRAQANLPIISKKDSSYFLINPIWDQRWIQETETSKEYAVQGLITWFNYSRNFGKKWTVQFSAIPRWMGVSSLQFSHGFQMGGAVLATRKIRPGLKYQFGAYYNKELFGNFFLPLLGIDWKINDRMNLFGILPGYLIYEHRLGKRLSWGGNFRTFTSSYRLDARGSANAHDYLRVQDNQVGVYTDWYIAPKVVLNLEAGHTIMRRIATGMQAKGGKDNEVVVSEKDNVYFRATLQYRMRFR